MGQFEIKQALTRQLETVGVVPLNYPNVTHKADNLKPFGDVTFIFNEPEAATIGLGGEDHHDGFVQVLLRFPLGEGDARITKASDKFRESFWAGKDCWDKSGSQLVTITKCGIGNFDTLDGKYVCPISIYWYSRTRRPE